MELVVFIGAVVLVATVYYFLCSVIYLAFTSRPIGAALGMSWKLALVTILGAPLFGFGGILLATLWFNKAMTELPNYKQWRDVLAGIVFSVAGSAMLYVVVFALAWDILG